ncbi:restriction endonuclease subunit S [Vibrio cholerae]|nr:restriction endonuclease subunit S [Vibrio cholerae]EHY0935730.1 restriction endonuclease subunit S [Vibrio cholerae]
MKIPNDWNMAKFGELAKITCGVAATPEYVDAAIGVPFLSARNVQKERLDLSYFQHIPRELHEKLTKNTKPAKGDVLLTRVGAGIGEAAVVDIDFEFSVYVSLTLIKCGKYLDSEYVKSLLNTNYYRYLATRDQFAGGGVQNLNVQMVKEYPIPVPPLPEQKKIAQILNTWDKAITTTEKLLANSQQQKKALMQQLLTGKKRLLDKNGAKYPEWKFHKVGKFFTPYKELVSADTNLPILTSSRTGLFEQERSVINEGSYGVLPKGYFTYRHMSDDLIFKFNLNRSWERGAISKEYPVFKTDGLDSIFLEAQLNYGPAFKKFAVQQKQGGTRTRLYYKNLCDFGFKMPSLEEQRKIAAVLSTADQEITALQQKLDALEQEKKALMQQLLTGKRRVKVDNKEVA